MQAEPGTTAASRQRGGKRAGAGRPSSYRPEVAEQMLAYVRSTHTPSIRHFAEVSGVPRKQIERWQLKHRCMMNAVGTLRYRRECDLGIAA